MKILLLGIQNYITLSSLKVKKKIFKKKKLSTTALDYFKWLYLRRCNNDQNTSFLVTLISYNS